MSCDFFVNDRLRFVPDQVCHDDELDESIDDTDSLAADVHDLGRVILEEEG